MAISKMPHYLDNCLFVGLLICLSINARTQSVSEPLATLPPSLLVAGDKCGSTPRVSELQSEIPGLVRSARWQALETVANELVRTCPDSDVGYHWFGVSYLRQGRSFAAIRALEDSLRRHDDAGAHLLLAEAYYELGQKRFFWEEIEISKRMVPQEAGIYYLAGLFCFQTEQAYDRAAEWFRKALDINPKHFMARCYLALSLQATQQYDEAESLLLTSVDGAQQNNPQAVTAFQLLASLELEMNRPSDALDHARMAARMAPTSAKVQLVLGKAAWAMRDQATALAAFKGATELDPESPEPHYLLSRVYIAQGQNQLAEQEISVFKHLRQLLHGSVE